MAFQTIPINIAGPSYQDRSRPLASQETRNLYHEYLDSGREKYVLKSFPGQKLFGSATAGIDRGQYQMAEINYRVINNILYEVSSIGTHTNKGTIPGSSRCTFADDGVNLFVVSDGLVSQYSNDTEIITPVTDIDIVGALTVTYINNQFIYTKPLLSVVSDVGDGSSATSLNAVGAETKPDDMVRDYAFDQALYRFGKRSTETWWNSGVGSPPIERLEGQGVNIGLIATHSVANSLEYIYWLGSDSQVYRARGGQGQVISNAAISGAMQKYTTVSDAFTQVFTIDNKVMIMFTFPSEGKTWCLTEELGINGWFQLSEGITDGRYNAGSIVEVYSKVLAGDRSNGNLYELDFDTYDQNGETWRRRRVMGSINGDLLKKKGARVQMSRMEFLLETGVGLTSGQGEDPLIMVDASYDGGRTWEPGEWVRIGREGEFNIRAEWFSMRSFYDMIPRITTSDPIALNIYSATIDLQLAGR